MAKTTKTKKIRSEKPKSIGPKFCAILLIFVLAIFALLSNLILLNSVRDEMKASLDHELQTAVDVLASSINSLYDHDPYAKDLALKMVNDATWDNGDRHFWAGTADFTEIIAGQKDYDTFHSGAFAETNFGFTVSTGYDKAYLYTNAYPRTEQYIRIATATSLVIALFALGACTIAFHRSSRC